MGYAVLKGLDAPRDVSSAILDVADPAKVVAEGCEIGRVEGNAGRFSFERRDAGLPLNIGVLGGLRFRFIPFGDELNRYTLAVRNLPAGRYDIKADDRGLGTWSAEQLAAGVNIASATANGWEPGGPWEAEAWVLRQLTDSRSEIAEAARNLRDYLPELPDLAQTEAQVDATLRRIEADQRQVVRPRAFRFVVEPHVDKPGKK